MSNVNFDALLSTTLANYRDQLTDNVFTDRVLTNHLMSKGRIRMLNGGTKIVEPLIYGQNTTVASYSGYDTISLTAQTGITAAEYEWKQYAASIAISGIEEAKNNGEQEIINLLEAKIMQAEESMREGFNTMFYGDGTGNSGKNWNGLGNLIEASGTVGNINRATAGNEYWQSYENNTAGALTIAQMATAYNTVSVGNDHPDLVLTTQTLFEKYDFRNHRQIDIYSVALFYAQRLQHICELLNFIKKLRIRHYSAVTWLTFPEESNFASVSGNYMTIEAVKGNIQFSTDKPLGIRQIPFTYLCPWLVPVQEFLRLTIPEFLVICSCFVVHRFIRNMGHRLESR